MNKSELRKMVREEIKKELYSILPQLLKETVNSIMLKEVRKAKKGLSKRGKVQEGVRIRKEGPPLDKMKLTAMIGYGDMRPGTKKFVSLPGEKPLKIGGVQMDGGLLARETEMGVAHMRDYTINPPVGPEAPADPANVEAGEIEEAYQPQFANLPVQPGGVDGGAEVPAAVVAALGKKSKEVLKEADFRANWRPGMKRPD